MKPSRSAFLSVIALVVIALVPLRAYAAAPPRIVTLADLASKPVEVAITSKHLTLIHFETGEVSMVAVGDPGLVTVTVKGADVLLKALTSSGSTNAFIWLGGRYTQWTFTVRQNTKDPRLIIVKDLAVGSGTRVEPRSTAGGTGGESRPATGLPAAAATTPGHVPSGISAESIAAPLPAHPPSPGTPSSSSAMGKGWDRGACESTSDLDDFVKTLTARQRGLFSEFLTAPSLATLQTLFLALNEQQRCGLLALLSVPATPTAFPSGSPALLPPTPQELEAKADKTEQAKEPTAEAGLRLGFHKLGRAGVIFSVTPQVVDGRLFLYYVLENRDEATLLTDILRLRVYDGHGQRVQFSIRRGTQDGYLGRLETGGLEYGLIAVATAEKDLLFEWNLVGFGSGEMRVARAAVQVP
jgi:hypothetical protein